MFVGDRWAQAQSTGGRLTGCGGGTKAAELLSLPWHHNSAAASQTDAERHHLLDDKPNPLVYTPVVTLVNVHVPVDFSVKHLDGPAGGMTSQLVQNTCAHLCVFTWGVCGAEEVM